MAIVVGVAVAGLAGPAGAAAGGNSANARLCQDGGFQSWVRADHTPFANVGDCVSYAAHGGTLTSPENASQLLCESFGGTFGNTNLTQVLFGSVLWSCNGIVTSGSASDIQSKGSALAGACTADGAPNSSFTLATSPSIAGYFTCGTESGA